MKIENILNKLQFQLKTNQSSRQKIKRKPKLIKECNNS